MKYYLFYRGQHLEGGFVSSDDFVAQSNAFVAKLRGSRCVEVAEEEFKSVARQAVDEPDFEFNIELPEEAAHE